jgi:hypothetical protein
MLQVLLDSVYDLHPAAFPHRDVEIGLPTFPNGHLEGRGALTGEIPHLYSMDPGRRLEATTYGDRGRHVWHVRNRVENGQTIEKELKSGDF